MSEQWLNITTFLTVYVMAIVTPGTNFVMVLNTTLASTRRTGLLTAAGVATGSGLFALAGLFGLIVMVNTIPYFDVVMGIVGGGYLIWTGVGLLLALRAAGQGAGEALPANLHFTLQQAFRAGLVTNLTNPKAWAFYFSLFTMVFLPDFPVWARLFLCATMFLISFAWYATVAFLASDQRLRPGLERMRPVVQGILGLLLIWLGGRLLWR